MRVFDFVGVMEAVGEIRETLVAPCSTAISKDQQNLSSEASLKEKRIEKEQIQEVIRKEVADSEDEAEEDEEMLFDAPDAVASPPQSSLEEHSRGAKGYDEFPEAKMSEEMVGMIIIDNFSQVLSPIIKRDFVQGTSHVPKLHTPTT